MTLSNHSGAGVDQDLAEGMAMYDSLPRPLRREMMFAYLNWSPMTVYEDWVHKRNTEFWMRRLREKEHRPLNVPARPLKPEGGRRPSGTRGRERRASRQAERLLKQIRPLRVRAPEPVEPTNAASPWHKAAKAVGALFSRDS